MRTVLLNNQSVAWTPVEAGNDKVQSFAPLHTVVAHAQSDKTQLHQFYQSHEIYFVDNATYFYVLNCKQQIVAACRARPYDAEASHMLQFDECPQGIIWEVDGFICDAAINVNHAKWVIWQLVSQFCQQHKVDRLVGTVAFKTTVPALQAQVLSYLHHFYRCQHKLRMHSSLHPAITMDVVPVEALDSQHISGNLNPFLRYLLRQGANVSENALFDGHSQAINVAIMVTL